jgi:outer membrane biosynthesis protein TonB
MSRDLDEKLSALLDGELPPEEAAALRAEIARSPELAARLAALAAVDEGLRGLPGRAVPADLRARLAARLAAEAGSARMPVGARRAPGRAGRRWLAGAALAAAAAALALLAWPRGPREAARVAQSEPAPVVPPPSLEPALQAPAPPAPPSPKPAPAPKPVAVAQQPPAPPPPSPAPEPLSFEPDEEEDLPVIAVLDVLAELDELEEVGSG